MAFRQKGPLFFKSALKRTGVFEYDEDGNKIRIPYDEGVKKANQYKNIQFTNKDLVKALESGHLDEFNHPSQQDEVKNLIAKTTKKMETMPSDELLFDQVRQEFIEKNGSELEELGPPPPNTGRKVMKDGKVNELQQSKIDAERARYNALTPEQKQAEQDAANDKADKFHKRGKYATPSIKGRENFIIEEPIKRHKGKI